MLLLHDQLSISDKFLRNVLKKSTPTIDFVDLTNKNATIKQIDFWMRQLDVQSDKTNFPRT